MSKSFRITLLASLLLWGCAAPPTMKDVEQVAADSSIVFGSVEVYEDGKQQEWGSRFFGYDHFYLTILPSDSNEAITYKLDNEGKFFWSLPAGEYTLLGYIWDTDTGQRTGRIAADFSAPQPGTAAYIGTVVFRGNLVFLVPIVEDKFEELATLYDAKFPDRRGTAARQLLEERKPFGTFAALRGTCNEDWQIACSKRFRGVTPISPDVTQSGFPVANDLMPVFRWKGCPKSDVSYDLILYEAAAYAVGGAMVPSYMRGRVVAYAQDLKESQWKPEAPLKPDTRYIWSVRLREGQTVSGWSTQSHSTFLLVYASWGHGQWFQFKTT
jgi:hypothetical protein